MKVKLFLSTFLALLSLPLLLWAQNDPKVSVTFRRTTLGEPFTVSYENAPAGASVVVYASKITEPAASSAVLAGGGSTTLTIPAESGSHYYTAQMAKNGSAISNKVQFVVSTTTEEMTMTLPNHVLPVGQDVEVTYENAPACPKDWLALYYADRPLGDKRGTQAWAYVNGNAGTIVLNGSSKLLQGYYHLYYCFEDNYGSYYENPIVLALGLPGEINLEKSYASPNKDFSIGYVDQSGEKDSWIGIFAKGADIESAAPVKTYSLDGNKEGTLTIPAGTLGEGIYTAYAFFDSGREPVANPVDFTLSAAADVPPTIACDVQRVRLGDNVTISYNHAPDNALISLYPKDATFDKPVVVRKLDGSAGSIVIPVPGNLENGTLYGVMYSSNGTDSAAVSNKVHFCADDIGGGFTLKSQQAVYAADMPVYLDYTNAPACPKDWFGIYPVGYDPELGYDPEAKKNLPGYMGASAWAYVNGQDATSSFKAPKASGYYAVWYLLENEYQHFADPIYICVGRPATLKADKGVYTSDEAVTLSARGMSTVKTDWVGVFKAGDDPATSEPVVRFETNGKKDSTFVIPAGTLKSGKFKAAVFYAGTKENISFFADIVFESKLYRLVKDAELAADSTKAYTIDETAPLITEADDFDPEANQVSSNAKETLDATTYAGLIDGDPATYFYSHWAAGGTQEPHYLQIDLKDNAVSAFKFKYTLADYAGGNGTYSWSQLGRWKDITISATNDTTSGGVWKEICRIDNLPTDVDVRSFYSPGINLGENYRYVRFTVRHTFGNLHSSNSIYPYFLIGDFQMYKATPDEANSLNNYDPATKQAYAALEEQIKKANEEMASGAETEETYTALQTALAQLRALIPDTTSMKKQIAEASTLADQIKVGTDYGDVTEEQYQAFTAVVAKAGEYDKTRPVAADLRQRMSELDEAVKLVNSQRITFELNKWYYITNLDEKRGGDPNNIWDTFCYGTAIYAQGDNIQDEHYDNTTDAIKWGYYDRENNLLTCLSNPYAMWRIVEMDPVAKTYALQNRATGTYMGLLVNSLGKQGMQPKPIPYYITHQGEGAFRIECADPSNTQKKPLHAAGDGFVYEYEGGYKTASSWTFQPVDESVDGVELPVWNNSIRIMCLPYAVADLASANDMEVHTYAVKDIVDGSTLELTAKDSFEAGEPFVITIGDYKKFNAANIEKVSLIVPAPEVLVTEAKTANGLVGNLLSKIYLNKPGLGYFENALAKATGTEEVVINGHSGYIDPTLVTPAAGNADLKVSFIGTIDGVTALTVDPATTVDVYTIEGKLLKRNVSASESLKGLKPGVYVVGKKKVMVK